MADKQTNIDFNVGMGVGESTFSSDVQLINWFPRATPGERSPTQLVSISGSALVATVSPASGEGCRGMWTASTGPASDNYSSTLYAVYGDTLFRIGRGGARVKIGTLQAGTSMCSFAENQDQTAKNVRGFVCDGTSVYTWDLLAEDAALPGSYREAELPYVNGSLTERAQVSYISYCAYRLIATARNSVQWYFSELNSEKYLSDSFESSESNPDRTVRCIMHGDSVWVLGAYSYDIYSPTFRDDDPFDKAPGASGKIGCASGDTVVSFGDRLLWLGQGDYGENSVIMADAGGAIKIASPPGIVRMISKWSYKDNARAFAFSEKGHRFYAITHPYSDMTLVLDVDSGLWHRRSSGIDGNLRAWSPGAAASCYGRTWFGTLRGNSLCRFDQDSGVAHDGNILRLWQSPTLTANGDWLRLKMIKVDVECGNRVGAGPDHALVLQPIWDGRESERIVRSLGAAGENLRQVAVMTLGMGRSLMLRLSTSSSEPVILYAVRIDTATSGRTA